MHETLKCFTNIVVLAPIHPSFVKDTPQYAPLHDVFVEFWVARGAQVIVSTHLSALRDVISMRWDSAPPVKCYATVGDSSCYDPKVDGYYYLVVERVLDKILQICNMVGSTCRIDGSSQDYLDRAHFELLKSTRQGGEEHNETYYMFNPEHVKQVLLEFSEIANFGVKAP